MKKLGNNALTNVECYKLLFYITKWIKIKSDMEGRNINHFVYLLRSLFLSYKEKMESLDISRYNHWLKLNLFFISISDGM